MILKLNHRDWGKPSWSMEINLHSICNAVGKKTQVQNNNGKWVYIDEYPKSRLRKVLKLIVQECSEDEVEQVLNYFNTHNKTCALELQKICNKVGEKDALQRLCKNKK